jgi:hypothetical protein
MKKHLIGTGFSMLTLAAIAVVPAQAETVTTVRYDCARGQSFRAEYYSDRARVAFVDPMTDGVYGEIIELPQSGDGTYSDGTYTLSTDDELETASVDVENGDDSTHCVARLVGVAEMVEVQEVEMTTRPVNVPRFNRPTLVQQTQAQPTPLPAPAPEPAPAPAPEPIPGLW